MDRPHTSRVANCITCQHLRFAFSRTSNYCFQVYINLPHKHPARIFWNMLLLLLEERSDIDVVLQNSISVRRCITPQRTTHCSSKTFTTSRCPPEQAQWSAVCRRVFLLSTCSPAARHLLTSARFPDHQASKMNERLFGSNADNVDVKPRLLGLCLRNSVPDAEARDLGDVCLESDLCCTVNYTS